MKKVIFLILVFALIFLATGCSHIKPGIEYRKFYKSSIRLDIEKSEKRTVIGVKDSRPYVLSKEKGEEFVGTSPNNLATIAPIYTDTLTFSRKPLANDISIFLADYLTEHLPNVYIEIVPTDYSTDDAVSVILRTEADIYLLFEINELRVDSSLFSAKYVHSFELTLIDHSGAIQSKFHETDNGELSESYTLATNEYNLILAKSFNNIFNNAKLSAKLQN